MSFPSFWISPEVNLFDTPIVKTRNKIKHKRCNSGNVSPYEDQSSLIKLKSALQTITRKQSPKNYSKSRNSPYNLAQKNAKADLPKKKKKSLKKKKKTEAVQEKLHVLNKKVCTYAPKIFHNQIFSDIYDEAGNHDRVMDTFEVSVSKTRIEDQNSDVCYKLVLAADLETEHEQCEQNITVKPPDNSFLAETERKLKNNHLELFEKLKNLAAERETNDEDI